MLTGGGAARFVFAGFKRVTTVHAFPNWSFIRPHTVLAILQRIRKTRYDLAIDASVRSRSGRFLLGLVTARYRIGYAWGSGWRDRCLSHAVSRGGEPPHMALTAAHLVRAALGHELSLPASNEAPPLLDVRVSSGERAEASALVARVLAASGRSASSTTAGDGGRMLVSLYPFATAAKNYSEQWWLQGRARAVTPYRRRRNCSWRRQIAPAGRGTRPVLNAHSRTCGRDRSEPVIRLGRLRRHAPRQWRRHSGAGAFQGDRPFDLRAVWSWQRGFCRQRCGSGSGRQASGGFAGSGLTRESPRDASPRQRSVAGSIKRSLERQAVRRAAHAQQHGEGEQEVHA